MRLSFSLGLPMNPTSSVGPAVTHDLGVLLVTGMADAPPADALVRLADAVRERLAGPAYSIDSPAGAAVTVTSLSLDQDGDVPAWVELRHNPLQPSGEAVTWLLAGSWSARWLNDRDPRPFLAWLRRLAPWWITEYFDRQATQARRLPGAWARRRSRSLVSGLGQWFGTLLLLAVEALLTLLLLLASLPLPGVRLLGRVGARHLWTAFGVAYVQAVSPTAFDGAVLQAADDLAWLRQRCRRVAVLATAHSVPIAHELLRRSPHGTADLLVTAGAALRKLQVARYLMRRHFADIDTGAEEALGHFLYGFSAIAIAVVYGLAAVVLAREIGWVPVLLALAIVPMPVCLVALWLARGQRRAAHAAVVCMRTAAFQDATIGDPSLRWVDLAAADDVVPDGPLFPDRGPAGWRHVGVTHRASFWSDHRGYLRNDSEALDRLAVELASLSPPPSELPSAGLGTGRRARVRWLVRARWISASVGMLAAIGLTPPLGPPTRELVGQPDVEVLLFGGLTIVGRLFNNNAAIFVVVWSVVGLGVYLLLAGCWALWDRRTRQPGATHPMRRRPASSDFYLALFMATALVLLAMSVRLAIGDLESSIRDAAAMLSIDHDDALLLSLSLLFVTTVLLITLVGSFLDALLSRQAVKRWRERRACRPDPAEAAETLLRRLPLSEVSVHGSCYRVAPITWDVRHKQHRFRVPGSALTLLRDDAVLLDVREGVPDERGFAHVRGRGVYPAGWEAAGGLRLARVRDWRGFKRDVPALLALLTDA